MERLCYYFDESGEKGFLRPDFSGSDIGLIAGIALPNRVVEEFQSEVGAILARLDTSDVEKEHATELFKDGRNADVRTELFDYLRHRDEWCLIYEAIYPLGFFRAEELAQRSFEKSKAANSRVKLSGNEKRLRIYTELLQGIIVKLDAMCRIEGSGNVLMISDRLDKGIHKETLQILDHLKQEVHSESVSGFDTETEQVIHGCVEDRVNGFDATIRHISDIQMELTPSTLAIAADIVTNSLFRHLRLAVESTPDIRLHSRAATNGFLLANSIALVDDDYLADTLYSPAASG